jgi:hypothetical protein
LLPGRVLPGLLGGVLCRDLFGLRGGVYGLGRRGEFAFQLHAGGFGGLASGAFLGEFFANGGGGASCFLTCMGLAGQRLL